MQGYKKISIFDLIIMALTVFGEASICADYEQVKVAWVILNRAEKMKWNIARVCFTPWHFSCWRQNRYLWRFVIEVVFGEGKEWSYEWKEFARCLNNCIIAIMDRDKGRQWGGLYYHDKSIPKPDTWDFAELIDETKYFKFYKEREEKKG